MPDAGEPGGQSNPEGDGPVGLADRTSPDRRTSPDTNQGRTEPMDPSPGGRATVEGTDPQGH